MGEAEDEAVDAHSLVLGDLVVVSAEDVDRDFVEVSAGLVGAGLDVLDAALDEARGGDVGQPAVGPVDHPLPRPLAAGADQDRRIWRLDRFRNHVGLRDVDEFRVILGLLLGPHLLHCRDPLFGDLPAVLEADAERLHLLGQPTGTDAEVEAAARDHVERGDLLGQRDWLVLSDQADAGAETNCGGGAGGRAEGDEGVVDSAVLLGQGAVF